MHVGGNPNVNPEFSDTITSGLVYQLGRLDGFATSLGYYDIRISDAINQIGVQNIMDECHERNAFCDPMNRDRCARAGNARHLINLEEFRVRGATLELSVEYGERPRMRGLQRSTMSSDAGVLECVQAPKLQHDVIAALDARGSIFTLLSNGYLLVISK